MNDIPKGYFEWLKTEQGQLLYLCRQCTDCYFYHHENMGQDGTFETCSWFNRELKFDGPSLVWISAHDYDESDYLRMRYDRHCPYYIERRHVHQLAIEAVESKTKSKPPAD